MTEVGTVSVSHCDSNGTWLIALTGEHDISTTPSLEQQTRRVWPRCSIVVVDLSEASFVDCSVINWVLQKQAALEATGQKALHIVEGPPGCAAWRVFDVACLHGVLSFHTTRQAALHACQTPAEVQDASQRGALVG